jgi:hypothetical protein
MKEVELVPVYVEQMPNTLKVGLLYNCDMSEWITNSNPAEMADDLHFTFAEKRALVKMKNERYKIYPGDKYYEQVGVQDGDFYCIQSRIDVYELCRKYDLWCE